MNRSNHQVFTVSLMFMSHVVAQYFGLKYQRIYFLFLSFFSFLFLTFFFFSLSLMTLHLLLWFLAKNGSLHRDDAVTLHLSKLLFLSFHYPLLIHHPPPPPPSPSPSPYIFLPLSKPPKTTVTISDPANNQCPKIIVTKFHNIVQIKNN